MQKITHCLIVDDEPVAREILENHLSRIPGFQLEGSCRSAVEAFKIINSTNIDLIFLDINMPEISGLSFARSINKNIKVIFTTAYREYAVDGFDLMAVDYLLKPISFERFSQAMLKYNNENRSEHYSMNEPVELEKNDFIFVRSDRKMIKINFSEVHYIESLSDYLKIHLEDKTIITRETISNLETMLPQNDFLRVHRSYIVALAKIQSYTNEEVEVGNHQIPISRSYKDEVLKRLTGTYNV